MNRHSISFEENLDFGYILRVFTHFLWSKHHDIEGLTDIARPYLTAQDTV